MDLGLKGKIALVAAASQGLGRAVAEELAAEGSSLIICARREKEITEVASEIERISGVAVLGARADLTVREDIENLVARGVEKFGRIDILVTNTGGPPAGQSSDAAQPPRAAAQPALAWRSAPAQTGLVSGPKLLWGPACRTTAFSRQTCSRSSLRASTATPARVPASWN